MPRGNKNVAARSHHAHVNSKPIKSPSTHDPVTPQSGPSQQASNDELAALQATEIEVLQSILGSDFAKVDADAQSAWHRNAAATGTAVTGSASATPSSPSSFQVTLRPDTDSLKTLVFATAHFRLPIRYPLLPPIVNVLTGNKAYRGLSTEHLKGLQDMLTSKSKQLAGNGEMIWDLVSAAQEYISLHNLERFTGPHRSLEEEKRLREVERQQTLRKKAQEESRQRTKEEEERASKIAELIREQAERNTAAMQQEKERKRDASVFSPSDTQLIGYLDERSTVTDAARKTEFFMDPIEQDGRTTHQVIVGPLVRSTPLSSVHLVESAENSNQTWQMESYEIDAPHYNLSSGKRAIEEVEWELDKLRMLRCESLVNVLACALVSHVDSHAASAKRLVIVQDAVEGPSVATILSHCVQLPWSRVRLYLMDILNGLDALHNRNLLHRDVSVNHVMLQGSPGKMAKAKLARAGYARRLSDMNKANPFIAKSNKATTITTTTECISCGWEAPEVTLEEKEQDGKAAYTRKRDMWHVGVVTLQMLFGLDIVERYPSPDKFFADASTVLSVLSDHVIVLLKYTLERSTRKRPMVGELRKRLEETIQYEDEELGATTLQASNPTDSDKATKAVRPRRGLTRTVSEQEDAFRPGSFWQMSRGRAAGNASRYENDFEELELLGKGAYGAVFKARNRLDGRDYAIKKIRLSASADNDEKTLREITALSRLSHQNIVRYVTCWIQVQDDPAASSTTGETLTSSVQTSTRDLRLPGLQDDFMSVGHDAFSHSASHIRFANSDSEDDENGEGEEGPRRAQTNGHEKDGDDSDGSSESSSSSSGSDDDDDDDDDHQLLNHSRMQQSFSLSNAPTPPTQPRWLFIQMEFVENQTLREAIDRGLTVEESWRLFRQMIEALAHVASLGIIHRDLKPSNILMFGAGGEQGHSAGDIKIGDFGLATTTTSLQGGTDGAPVFGTTDESVDQTTEIGTNLYIAPEVLKAGASRYDYKVDVYAAGIVFFEMLASQRVYKTGMERIQTIRDLRLPDVSFPKGWNEAQLPAQTKIIRRMLSHDPAERPSPLELLKSDLLPPKMEDEYIAECMRLLSMPNSTYNLQLMESLFERKETSEHREARDFTFDTGSNEGQGLDNRFIGVASQHLRSLFHRRGAVELEAPLLLPPNEIYTEEQHKPVELLDKTGKVVQLPFDLVVPFARMVARGEQQRFKRYAIAPVYRANLLAGGQPRSVTEVDFDIVAPEKTPAAEAEVLGVVDEILEEVPGLNASEWVVQISHGAVLDLLLERVPPNRRDQAIAAIGQLTSSGKAAAAQGRVRLSSLGLPRSITDEIDSANLSDDIEVVHEKLQRLLAVDLRPRLARATEEIRKVIEAAQQFGVQRRFLFTPLLVSSTAFYRDNVYFVVIRSRGKRRDVLASGGRYDALLKHFASPTLAHAPAHAVGIQIALGRVALALAKHHELVVNGGASFGEERAFGPFTPRRCDVYVASAPGLLSTRIEICRELWGANISADLAYEHALEESPELLASTCKAEGILFLVIARSRGSVVKVKSIVNRTEHEVSRWELSGWIADRIQRLRNVVDAGGTGPGGMSSVGERAMSSAGGLTAAPAGTTGASMQHAGEVEVILPERQLDKRRADKHGFNDTRRGRKQAYLAPMQENAARQVAKVLEDMGGGAGATKLAILAVDVNVHPSGGGGGVPASPASFATSTSFASTGSQAVTAFHRLCAAALARTDDGLWKLFLDCLSADEREYGKQLRRRITELGGRAWLVSVRSEGAVALI